MRVSTREKSIERDSVRTSTRDTTKYDLTVGEALFPNLPKRRLILALVREAIGQGRTPDQIRDAIAWRKRDLFLSAPGHASEATFQALFPGKKLRYFFGADDAFFLNETTYVLSRAWGDRTIEAAELVKQLLRSPNETSWEPTFSDGEEEEATYDGYVIRRLANGVIQLERDGRVISPAMPVLRKLAEQLDVSTAYESGTEANTQQLGKRIISAIQSA